MDIQAKTNALHGLSKKEKACTLTHAEKSREPDEKGGEQRYYREDNEPYTRENNSHCFKDSNNSPINSPTQ